ncbi:MAG TPA: zinc-ribbon domain-containing protein [Thermoplasmatales archaeon]|nr:zinc-ribbon domain-containing protein [Candidatus Thermoplasmatota archaeon]HDS59109.1 zinc-ribbon domain-containing protein [Thermoplasmatales archaeon]
MPECPQCGTSNPARAKFCMECSAPLPRCRTEEEDWDQSSGGP